MRGHAPDCGRGKGGLEGLAWSEIQELTTARHGLFAERRATVRTAHKTLQFVLEDSHVPAWSPGRALGRARRLCSLIVARAGLTSEPGTERFRRL